LIKELKGIIKKKTFNWLKTDKRQFLVEASMIAKYILGEYLLNSIRNQKSNNTIFRFTEYVVEPKCYFISIELQKKRMLIFLFSECLKQAHSLKNLSKKQLWAGICKIKSRSCNSL
jgi:hypothetical protein